MTNNIQKLFYGHRYSYNRTILCRSICIYWNPPPISGAARKIQLEPNSFESTSEVKRTLSETVHATGAETAKKMESMSKGIITYDPNLVNKHPHIDLPTHPDLD